MSKSYENRVAKEIEHGSPPSVRARRLGYSGSNAFPCGDIKVCAENLCHEAELKGPIRGDVVSIELEELEDLVAIQNKTTNVYLIVKFTNREPLVICYYPHITDLEISEDNLYGIETDSSVSNDEVRDWDELDTAQQFAFLTPDCFNPRVSVSKKTGVERLYLDRPDTDEWPSARAGKGDIEAIADGMVGVDLL